MSRVEKDWLIEARSGRRTTYAELRERLNRTPAMLRPRCQPASVQDALCEITAALAYQADLLLFDADFGSHEIEVLGFLPREINQLEAVPAAETMTQELLANRARGDSRARLGLFTSGSTGLPKLVWQSATNLARAVKVSPRLANAVWALAYNPTHIAGIQVYLQALANGCTVVDVYGLDRAAVLEAIERHGVTHVSGTPSFYRLLFPADRPLPGVRSVALGGESADAGLFARLRGLFPQARLHNIYASTEAGTLLVAEGDVFAIAPGLEGEVVLREGRLKVHRMLLGEFEGQPLDGDWYDTGDCVEILSEQPLRFRILTRERDWMNVGGSKVNPLDVEATLAAHPGVDQVRVFGRANSVMGCMVCAEVVARSPAPSEAELRAFAAERLQPFKVPRIIRFVDHLSVTRTGKLFRS